MNGKRPNTTSAPQDAGGFCRTPKRHVQWAAVLTVLTVFSVAQTATYADTVDVQFLGLKGGAIDTNLGNGGAGAFKWKKISGSALPYADDSEFLSFCIDIFEHVNTSGPSTYNVVDPADAPNNLMMGAAKAGLMSHWFGSYYKGNSWDNWTSSEARAFQMGVWEIVYEDLNLIGDLFNTNHSFYINGPESVRSVAQDWFNDVTWRTGNTLSLAAISSPSGDATGRYQDQIVVVPLPAAFAAGLPLLGGLGLARRVRGRRRVAVA